jgi:uncharacterized repeat protein (TIGR01451 family)
MSNYHRPKSPKSAHRPSKSKQYINSLARSLALIGLIASGNSVWLSSVLASSTPAATPIDNQASGTFTDSVDPSAGIESVLSNIVSVTVAEVAGIVITSVNTPNAVLGTTANFDFKIQNIGNDPTQFQLPTAPSSITGGTAGTLQAIAYIRPDGSQVNLATPLNITSPTNTSALGDGKFEQATLTAGAIPADAALIVRVPVTVSSGATSVSVTLGNTTSSPSAINTPYIASTNDVYTVDPTDPNTIAGETLGVPANGVREASAAKTVTIIPPATVTCPTGTTGSGGGYATGGSGQYLTKNAIYWLDWNCGTTSQFNPGSIVTKSWAAPNGVVVTATVSKITKALRPYNTGAWGGDKLDDLYSGVNPIGLLNVNDGEDPTYTVTFTMTLNGVPIQSDIVTAEAEDTGNINEFASWTTDGNAWEALEAAPSSSLNAMFSNSGKTVFMEDYANAGGGALVALTENVTNINVAMNAGGSEAIAFGIMVPFDYGDAPTSYGSAPHFARRDASGGSKPAAATNVNGLTMATLGYGTPYLGAIGPDPESTPFNTAAGAPATADNTNGTSDEDAFTTLPNVSTIGSYALNNIPVNNTSGTSAILHAWVDFNKDGKFQASEYTSVSIPNNATTANLNWASIPAGTTAGATYARFRITTQSMNDDPATTAVDERSTLTAIDGEVEDYNVTIVTSLDFGDAPSDLSSIDASLNPAYPTLAVNNGASHALDGIHYLGAGVGAETDGQPTFNADGDSQDDGVTFPTVGSQSAIVVGQNNTITVNASTTGILNAWIDWNQDGKWDPSEQIALNQAMTAGNNTVTVNAPNTVPHGKTYARFRFSTQSNLQPTGAATDGEVEDYAINVAIPEITQCTAPLLNGGFELPNISSSTPTPLQVFTPNIKSYREADVPGWATISTSPNALATGLSGTTTPFEQRNSIEIWQNGNLKAVPAYSGQQFAEINSYLTARLHQDVITTPGVTMRWQFAHRGRDGNDTIRVRIGAAGATTDQGSYTTGNTGWKVYSGTYTIPAGQNITRFEFEAVSSALGDPSQGNFIDDIQFGVDCAKTISGTVFEDPNYGGGAGRNLATATTSPRDGATVELYRNDGTGTYFGTTTTSGGGKYTFTGVSPGDYKVRVVNSTVTSSRPNPTSATGLVAVQTFRTDAGVTAGTVTAVTDHVGGEIPKEVDAPANTTASLTTLNAVANQEVQSLTAVKVGSSDITGIDFGYNFDTIVNTNATGQGSLDQFITNSNTLHGEASLAQANQTSGKETSIFMISNGLAHAGLTAGFPNLLATTGANSGAAVISPSLHYVISDSNTNLDGRTQTTNVGDTNTGTVGTGGTVGVDALTLDTVPRPEIVINFNAVPVNTNGIQVSGANTLLAGFATYGYHPSGNVANASKVGMIYVLPAVPDSGKTIITQLLVGTSADGTDPGTALPRGHGIVTDGGTLIQNNYIAYNGDGLELVNHNGTHVDVINNELTKNGPKDNSSTEASGDYVDNMETDSNTTNFTIRGNYIHDPSKPATITVNTQGQGIQISPGSSNGILDNNTFARNNRYGINSAGTDITITKNIIYGTTTNPTLPQQGIGIDVYNVLRNRISQNSLYNNNALGIDLGADGVTANNGITDGTKGNNGIDYPVITSSTLSSGELTVKGYVGDNTATSNGKFGSLNLEFFIAADDGNQNGAVLLGDGKSKPHGEGKTYLPPSGTCTTDANSQFTCTFLTAGTLGLTDAKNITATATDSLGNTSEFSAVPSNKADVLMVKRITAIKDGITGTVTPYNTFVDDTTSTTKTNDNNCGWQGATGTAGVCTTNTYTVGATSETALKVKPGDEIEYTIYYLNAGENKATQARICDQLDKNLTFKQNFDSSHINAGISLVPSGGTAQYLTNGTDSDSGQLTLPTLAGTSCNLTANTGTNLSDDVVVVDIGNPTNPLIGNGYGYIRFKATVK